MKRLTRAGWTGVGTLLLTLSLATAWAGEESEEACCPEADGPVVVELKLSDLGSEAPVPQNPFGPPTRNFRESLEWVRSIAFDPDVAGVRLHVDSSMDFARSLDVLKELRRIQSAKKKIVCYAESLNRTTLMYASLSDLLAVPPSATLMLEGVNLELMYMRDLLGKLGVTFEVMHIGDYKTAYEDFSRQTMSDGQRETLQCLVDEYYNQIVETIADHRGITSQQVEAMFDQFIVSPQVALDGGLIDAVVYEDEFEARVEKLFEGPVNLVDDYGNEEGEDFEALMSNPLTLFAALPKLLGPQKEELPPGPKIAIVYASGGIASGKSQAGLTGQTMGSETIVEALKEVEENDEIKAVILRVNSPGGSALASDMIWRAIERVKAKKPVIASMGAVAASGGYWISMGCDRILAQSSTLTGSIGVVSAVPNLTGTLEKIGINVEVVGAGPRSEELAILRNGVTPFLRERVTHSMEEVYSEFIKKASTGRKMDAETLEKLARGRVWTGRQAKENGLIDAIGGLEEAIVMACHLGGRLDPKSTPIVEVPEPPDFFTQLEEALGQFARTRSPLVESLQLLGFGDLVPVLETIAQRANRLDSETVQCVLPFWFRIR